MEEDIVILVYPIMTQEGSGGIYHIANVNFLYVEYALAGGSGTQ